jgi:hypothetical protein
MGRFTPKTVRFGGIACSPAIMSLPRRNALLSHYCLRFGQMTIFFSAGPALSKQRTETGGFTGTRLGSDRRHFTRE